MKEVSIYIADFKDFFIGMIKYKDYIKRICGKTLKKCAENGLKSLKQPSKVNFYVPSNEIGSLEPHGHELKVFIGVEFYPKEFVELRDCLEEAVEKLII